MNYPPYWKSNDPNHFCLAKMPYYNHVTNSSKHSSYRNYKQFQMLHLLRSLQGFQDEWWIQDQEFYLYHPFIQNSIVLVEEETETYLESQIMKKIELFIDKIIKTWQGKEAFLLCKMQTLNHKGMKENRFWVCQKFQLCCICQRKANLFL